MTYQYRDHSLSSYDTYLMAREYLEKENVEVSKENFRALCNTLVTYMSLYYKAARESIANDNIVRYAVNESVGILLCDLHLVPLGRSLNRFGALEERYSISYNDLNYFATLICHHIKIAKSMENPIPSVVTSDQSVVTSDQFKFVHRMCHDPSKEDLEILCKANPIPATLQPLDPQNHF